jgi:hypothetical protein
MRFVVWKLITNHHGFEAMHHPESGKQHFGISARRLANCYYWETCATREGKQRHQSWHRLDLSRNKFAEGFFPLFNDGGLIALVVHQLKAAHRSPPWKNPETLS